MWSERWGLIVLKGPWEVAGPQCDFVLGWSVRCAGHVARALFSREGQPRASWPARGSGRLLAGAEPPGDGFMTEPQAACRTRYCPVVQGSRRRPEPLQDAGAQQPDVVRAVRPEFFGKVRQMQVDRGVHDVGETVRGRLRSDTAGEERG